MIYKQSLKTFSGDIFAWKKLFFLWISSFEKYIKKFLYFFSKDEIWTLFKNLMDYSNFFFSFYKQLFSEFSAYFFRGSI